MNYFSKKRDDSFRRGMKHDMEQEILDINTKFNQQEHEKVGPNVFILGSRRGTYFITNDEGVVVGAIYCSNCRDVITVGLGSEHADIIKTVVFIDAIVGRGIKPLQTMEDSIPPELREALGFVGPEKDEYTSAKRWVLR